MTKRDEVQLVSRNAEFVYHSEIAHPQAKLRTSLQAVMRKICQTASQASNPVFEPILHRPRQAEKIESNSRE